MLRLPTISFLHATGAALWLLLVLPATPLRAGEVRLTLESAPAYALRHNPTLAAARLRLEEARGRHRQAGRLANPELELELNRNVRAPEGTVAVALTQRFPLTARLRLEKAVTAAELAGAAAEIRDAERKLSADVSVAAVKLLGLAAQQALREKQLGNTRELSGFMRKRVELGEGSSVDASIVELDAQQLRTELLQLAVERVMLVGELRPLLGLPAGAVPALAGSLPGLVGLPTPSVDPAARPDFAAAQSAAEAARHGAALARAQKWQDIGVGLSASEQRTEDAPEGFRRDTFIGLRFSLALPFWNDNAGRIQEAAAAAARAQKETEALALTIGAEAAAARGGMAALGALVSSLERDLLPQATQIEEQLRTNYAAGQAALTDVLRARDRRLSLERQRLEALRDYHLARIRYTSATGANLPRRATVQAP